MSSEIRETDRVKPLIDYIKKNLDKGYKIEDLKWALINQGNSRVAVEKAVNYVNEFQDAQKPKKQEISEPQVLQPEINVEEEKKGFFRGLGGLFKKKQADLN